MGLIRSIFLDSDLQVLRSHTKLFGQATGGAWIEVTYTRCVTTSSGCYPVRVFREKLNYDGSATAASDDWDLGLFNREDLCGVLRTTT